MSHFNIRRKVGYTCTCYSLLKKKYPLYVPYICAIDTLSILELTTWERSAAVVQSVKNSHLRSRKQNQNKMKTGNWSMMMVCSSHYLFPFSTWLICLCCENIFFFFCWIISVEDFSKNFFAFYLWALSESGYWTISSLMVSRQCCVQCMGCFLWVQEENPGSR